MEDLLQLLKEKLVLAAKLAEAAEKQRRALKENLNGRDVTAATREVEGLLARLDACERDTATFLTRIEAPTLAEAVSREAYSPRKMQAKQYLDRLNELAASLRETNGISRTLLEKDRAWLGFGLNVMTEAQAGPGYDAPEEPDRAVQGRKLFDQSV